jgi:hypothetical protein
MTKQRPPAYRRIIFELSHGVADVEALHTVGELARLLGLELRCLFIEDEAVLSLAALPFAREFQLGRKAWSPMDQERIAAEFRDTAGRVRRTLESALGAAGVASAFEVLRGDPADFVAALCQPDDIVVVADPGLSLGRAAYGFTRLRLAAHHSAAAVMLMPTRLARNTGPVAVLARGTADPALEIACRIAVAANEGLTVLLRQAASEASHRAAVAGLRENIEAMGLPRDRVVVRRLSGERGEDVLDALAGQRERLIVLAQLSGNDTARIAAERRVPVLIPVFMQAG